MPIYEYQCAACEHRLEMLQKFSDEPLRDCPECQAPELKKLISPVAFRLKGSGWYETDFKSGNRRNVLETDKAEAKGGKDGAKAESGSDKAKADKSGKGDANTAAAKPSTSGAA